MSVSLEKVVRLFFARIAYLSCPPFPYIMEEKKDGGDYERETKSFVPEQPAEDTPLT